MSDQVAIVTGAGRGLGRSIAESLASRGVAVVLAGRTESHLREVEAAILARGESVSVAVADVSDSGSVAETFARTLAEFGRLDILINNAGIAFEKPLADLEQHDWDRLFDTNVRGMFLCSREAGRHFAEAGRGRAINIASVWGLLGRPGYTAYCASKGAMINFTRSAAAEWARFGAQMNAVAPGYFATDINAELRANADAVAKVLRRVPARRMGKPAELSNLVGYLALEAPDYLTGQTIAIDGGESSV
jgi:3-oxoacyl-[acyl-carrier protein] reductase/2-deoxy-D-gluconate 3-dehydrogenase